MFSSSLLPSCKKVLVQEERKMNIWPMENYLFEKLRTAYMMVVSENSLYSESTASVMNRTCTGETRTVRVKAPVLGADSV